jgi:pseudouridine-5'-phosphate glycosidase
VPVIGYQTNELPAFYSRISGLPIEIRVETAQEIATIIKAHDELGLPMGTLIANPIPSADEWPAPEAQSVIEQALRDAEAERISGKGVTPYLLRRVSELSGERSKKANIALLLNNARLAAQIAQALKG